MICELVQRRLDSLTKPPGSLGWMEEILVEYARIRGTEPPVTPRAAAYILCGDHGVVAEGVSAWPSEVTRQMAMNFVAGGAAISVMCRHYGIAPQVVDVGIAGAPVDGVRRMRVGNGTRNFSVEPAMSLDEARWALDVGRTLAAEAAERYDIVACGEMGIGNTTAAAALLCAYGGVAPEEAAGAGAGSDADGVRRKVDVLHRALALHASREPLEVAAAFGGFEILAIAGMILGGARDGLPVVLDGFISCAAALVARALEPEALRCVFYSHRSAEKGHRLMLEVLGARPRLDLDMRLGEGSGAALLIGIFQTACRIYHEMATFDGAGVSRSHGDEPPEL
ncbi:MAG: nicotinate-nucleotide--dimethylbenzimidazole phosphoribosyltransferase [Bryobacterales bacterium]|nr:nicotinate-nucleotide--dimethylbenzimidazole phosphoribosyltransferase [Bryobacterales bacterium]